MTPAIATQLKSITDPQTKLIELSQADTYWQTKINQALTNNSQPLYIIFPDSIASLATIVQQAFEQKWRLLICGNGSKLAWGKLAEDIQLIISIQKCDRLIEHAVGDLTVTVEAGMKLADLQTQLKSHNQFLPIDPSYPETATLGGIVATADTGSWRERYGGIRDLLLGISFVRADGAIAKAGGRVVKNVAGYDLMKLFTGAYGTLGIIAQLTFRTFPLIDTSQTILITGKGTQIGQITQTIRNSGLTPTAMDLLSSRIIQQLGFKEDLGLIIRWQTITESIQQQVNQVKAIANQLNIGTADYQDQAEIDVWQKCANMATLPESDTTTICKLGIAPTEVINFLQLEEIAHHELAVRIHASTGIGQFQSHSLNHEAINKMRSHCQKHYGFLTILNAPKETKQKLDVWGYQGNAIQTMTAIKTQFDPQNLLNPSRFIV